MFLKKRKSLITLLVAIIAALLLCVGALCLSQGKKTAYAATTTIYWGVTDDGKLIISAADDTGAPATKKGSFSSDSDYMSYTPWSAYSSSITSAEVRGGVAPSSTASWFYNMTNLASVDLSGLDASNVTDMRSMFSCCSKLTSLDLSSFDTSSVTSMNCMFSGCSALTSLDFPASFNTSKVTDMRSMFFSCSKLTSLDLSSFDTSNVTDMSSMFQSCMALTSITFGENFKTSNVTNMYGMFYVCSKLTSLDLSSFDTSNVTDMHNMFAYCSVLTSITFGENFNTSNVNNMNNMFYNCSKLTSLDLSSFDTSSVTDMSCMFQICRALTSIAFGGNFNTSNVTNMYGMFFGCNALTSLDLSSFNTSKVTDMSSMLSGCNVLNKIKTPNTMATGQSIALPAKFWDGGGTNDENYTNQITSAYTAKTLLKHAACNLSGNYDYDGEKHWKTCTICGKNNEAAHTGGTATCMAAKTCTYCGKSYGELAEHISATAVRENEVAATCTAAGSYDEVVYCSVCNEELSRKTLTIVDPDAHSFGEWQTEVAANCTQTGTKAHKDCTLCNKHFDSSDVEITDLTIAVNDSHDWGDWTESKAATCTDKGEETRECSRSSSHKETRETDANGHSWNPEAVRVEPDCTTDGSVTGTCDKCGATDVEVLPKLGHDKEQHEAKAATCTEKGWDAYETCSRCDYSTKVETDALGHDLGEFTVDKAATCTEKGSKSKHCSRCDEKAEVTEIEKIAHVSAEAVRENEVAATCTAEGAYDEVIKCSVCKSEISRTKKTIEKIAHTLTHVEGKEATTEETGNIEYWSCTDCEQYFSDADGETVIADKASVELPKKTPVSPDPVEPEPITPDPEKPSAPTEETKSYWWLFWLLIPLALAVCGITFALYDKRENENKKQR